jgi:hypothetical protein
MEVTTKANSIKTRSQDTVTTSGLMVSLTLETGLRIKWTVMEFSDGETERNTRVTLLTTNAKVKARLSGPTAESTSVIGRLVSSTELEPTSAKMEFSVRANGLTAANKGGSETKKRTTIWATISRTDFSLCNQH